MRRRQKSRAWASELARAASAMRLRSAGLLQSFGQQPLRRTVGLQAGRLQQRVPRVLGGERIACARHVLQNESENDVGHDLEGGEAVARPSCARPNSASAVSGSGSADEGGGLLRRLGEELQDRGRDDAERPFRADEQVLQVVARVVLLEAPEAVPDAPVGQHHLEAERQLARVAVGQHADAAGVGGEVAADPAAALGGQAQREQPIDAVGRGLRLGQGEACFDRHGVACRVERTHAPQAGDRQQDLPVHRRLPADQAGIAGLRHHGDAVRMGKRHDCRYLLGRAGPQHDRRAALVHVAPLAQIGQLQLGIGERVLRPDDGGKTAPSARPSALAAAAFRSWRPRRPPQPVVDGLAKPLVRDRHDGDGACAGGVERAQGGEEVGGGLGEIARCAEVDRRPCMPRNGAAEGQQRLAVACPWGVEPQLGRRRVVPRRACRAMPACPASPTATARGRPSTRAISSRATPPRRRMIGSSPVTSTTVDSRPTAVAPPSRIIATRFPRSASTCAAVVGLTRPDRLALGAAIGRSTARSRACAMAWLGTRNGNGFERRRWPDRRPRSPAAWPSPATALPARTLPPAADRGGVSAPSLAAASTSGTCTISGLKRGRPLAAKMAATATAVGGVGAEAVHGLGRKGDELAAPQAPWRQPRLPSLLASTTAIAADPDLARHLPFPSGTLRPNLPLTSRVDRRRGARGCHDLSGSSRRHRARAQDRGRPRRSDRAQAFSRGRRGHHPRRHRRGRQVRRRGAGAAERAGRPRRLQARRRQGRHPARLEGGLSAVRRRRLGRARGAGGVGRAEPAARDRHRRRRGVELRQPGLRPVPAADPRRHRCHRGAGLRRAQAALPAEDGVGRVDRHDEPDRAARGLRPQPAQEPRGQARPTAATASSAPRSSSPTATTR